MTNSNDTNNTLDAAKIKAEFNRIQDELLKHGPYTSLQIVRQKLQNSGTKDTAFMLQMIFGGLTFRVSDLKAVIRILTEMSSVVPDSTASSEPSEQTLDALRYGMEFLMISMSTGRANAQDIENVIRLLTK